MKAVSKTAETLQRILWPGWHQKKRRERKRGEKKTGKNTVQTSLTSLGQTFSSPSLHFVLHFCVLLTFFGCFPLVFAFLLR